MSARVGEESAQETIERLFSSLSPTMWRAVLGYTGDPDIAADAVAEAFTLALEHPDDIRSPSGWLWRVAFRLATEEVKRRRKTSGDVPDRPLVSEEPAVDILQALSRLSSRQRGAIVLHYYADQPVAEVARILGSTPAAVRVHLMRGRNHLRDLLEEHDG